MNNETYSKDGVFYWQSNDHVCMPDALDELGIYYDPIKQQEARNEEIADFVKSYRKNYQPPSAEQLYEMEAAFGKGAKVVDIISGHVTQL